MDEVKEEQEEREEEENVGDNDDEEEDLLLVDVCVLMCLSDDDLCVGLKVMIGVWTLVTIRIVYNGDDSVAVGVAAADVNDDVGADAAYCVLVDDNDDVVVVDVDVAC